MFAQFILMLVQPVGQFVALFRGEDVLETPRMCGSWPRVLPLRVFGIPPNGCPSPCSGLRYPPIESAQLFQHFTVHFPFGPTCMACIWTCIGIRHVISQFAYTHGLIAVRLNSFCHVCETILSTRLCRSLSLCRPHHPWQLNRMRDAAKMGSIKNILENLRLRA